MVPLPELWMPIGVATVLVFFASFMAWMVLPHHRSDWKRVNDEDGLMNELKRQKLGSGQYSFPHCESPAAMKDPAWQAKMNLVGPSTLPDIWRRHFLDSAQLYPLLPGSGHAVLYDLGTGAGFPGLVLAIMTVMGVTNHMGWEMFPRRLVEGRAGRWLITASHQVIILWWIALTAIYVFVIHFKPVGNWIFAMGGDSILAIQIIARAAGKAAVRPGGVGVVDGQRPALKRVQDDQRDQLLREVVRPVVVGAVGRERRQPVSVVVGPHEMIRSRLRRRIRRVGRVGGLLGEVSLGPQRPVDLVRRDVQEPEVVAFGTTQSPPVLEHGPEQPLGLDDVGPDELGRAVYRAVHVRLGGEVHDRRWSMLLQEIADQFPVPDRPRIPTSPGSPRTSSRPGSRPWSARRPRGRSSPR